MQRTKPYVFSMLHASCIFQKNAEKLELQERRHPK